MSKRYPGGYLTASPVLPTATSAPGVWTLEQQYQANGAGNWPAAANYQINKSLRFRSSASAYLNRTPASASNRKTWTFSAWVKKSAISARGQIFVANYSSVPWFVFGFENDNTLTISATAGSSASWKSAAVFRDPSAWYHVMCVVDTTSSTSTMAGTSTDRFRMYVNGVQQVISGGTVPTQNSDLQVNNSVSHLIAGYSTEYFDGYIAETNFIDGVALTPSSFGTTDAYGIWQPIPYSGAYGTNGFYLPFTNNATQAYAGSFSGSSQWVSVPNLSAFNVGTSDYTVEGYFYFNSLPSSQGLFGCDNGAGSTPKFLGLVNSSGAVLLEFTNSGGATFLTSSSGAVTTGKWYHIAWVRNSGTSTIYVNGISVGSTATSVNLAGLTQAWNIGYIGEAGPSSFNGYISNFRLVTGTAIYTGNFVPPSTGLTAVSGTQILTLQNSTLIDNSSNAQTVTNTGGVSLAVNTPFAFPDLTADQSGNANNWVANNISLTAGSTYDSMLDSPTNNSSTVANYATGSPVSSYSNNITWTDGNLKLAIGLASEWRTSIIPFSIPSNKWYWEVTLTATVNSGDLMLGIINSDIATATISGNSEIGSQTYGYGYYSGGLKVHAGSNSSYGATWYTSGDVIGVAFDASSGSLTFYKNGSSQGEAYAVDASKVYVPAISGTKSGGTTPSVAWNFGQQPFVYTAPTGFLPLNTYNLPNSNVPVGGQYMNAVTWTGTGTASGRSITGVGFKPDFVWGKARSVAYGNGLYDSVRGTGKLLVSNNTNAEATNFQYGYLSSFDSDGFTTAPGSTDNENWNETSSTYVAWNWKANQGTNVSNTNGSITSTVSANPTAGFSVVTYTGTGSAATVGHGLGVAPSMIIVKGRSVNSNWPVWHTVTNGNNIYLNATDAASSTNYRFSGTPNSTTFGISSLNDVNTSSATYIAYCFSAVSGYSAFGSYPGNSSSDGPFIYTGFKPRYILIKNTSNGTTDWYIFDTARNTYNVANTILNANLSSAELTGGDIDILSNGFKPRVSATATNKTGDTYIYACFAESPFKMARAR